MGNVCGNRPKETIKTSFDQFEIEKLRKIYNEVKDQPTEEAAISSDRKLQTLFPENPKFARKLYRWMEANNGDKEQIEFNIFAACFEMFLKENLEYHMVQYHFRKFEKIEIMALISMEKKVIEKNEFEKLSITYSQALMLFSEISNMFFENTVDNSQIDDIGAKVVANSIFGNNCAIDFNLFIDRVKHQFENINKIVKEYFSSKIFERSVKLKVPSLDSPSYILNHQLISLFYLSNNAFSNYDKLKLIYSNTDNALSFEKLALALINSNNMETLILIKTVQTYDDSKYVQDNVNVFGAYCSTPWRRIPETTGDANSYIFSLIPKFRNFYTKYGDGGTHFCYLNVSNENKKGIGFGGDGRENFRIWLDEDLQNRSYVMAEDNTYENGYLMDPAINVLKISLIEVWGLRNEGCYADVENLRISKKIKNVESMRKTDRSLLRDAPNGDSYKKNPELMTSLVKTKLIDNDNMTRDDEEEEVVYRPNNNQEKRKLDEIFEINNTRKTNEQSQFKKSAMRAISAEKKTNQFSKKQEDFEGPIVRSTYEKPNTYQHRNEFNPFQSVKMVDERKTYDANHALNKSAELRYNTLENLNQGHTSYIQPSNTSGNFNNPNNYSPDFESLNQRYSKQAPPGNVQDIIDKMKSKKSQNI